MNRTQIVDMRRMQRANRWSDAFFRIEFFLCFLINIFTIMKSDRLVSLCFTLSFIVLLFFFLHTLMKSTFERGEGLNLVLLSGIIAIAFVAILISYNSTTVTLGYFKKYSMFSSTVMLLFIASKISIERKTLKFIFILNILIGFAYIYSYFFISRVYIGGGITFNFTNPNLTAMWLLQTILYIFISILYLKSKVTGILSLGIIGFLSYFLIETRARTSLLALVLFFALTLYISMKKSIKLGKIIIVVLVLFPILFAVVYFALINTGDITIMSFMQSQGKSLYSREIIWAYAFGIVKEHPLLGAYYQISNGTGMSQMHNTHVDILASYGGIVFTLLMIYITRIVMNIYDKCASKLEMISLMAFLSAIVMGMGEAALFSGGQGIYILSCSFLLIARNLNGEKERIFCG